MHKVRIEKVCPGMVVGKSIYNINGCILLSVGQELRLEYIERLKKLGVPSIYIQDQITEDLEAPEIISELTRIQTQQQVTAIFRKIESGGKVNLGQTQKMVNTIIDELLSNPMVMVQLTDIRTYDSEIFGHSVSVGILSIMIATLLGYNQLQVRDLGVGSILHDIGKVKIDPRILNKPDKLTPEEFAEVKKHAWTGFEILRNQEDFNLLSAHIALQHHERYDGSGYPRGLKEQLIQQYARITAIADVYDAMTSDRIYRPAYTSLEAVQSLLEGAGTLYDPDIVNVFIKQIAVYPVGSIVVLNTGEVGLVVDTPLGAPEQPIVKVIFDSEGKKAAFVADLRQDKSRQVIRLLNTDNDILPSVATIGSRIINQG